MQPSGGDHQKRLVGVPCRDQETSKFANLVLEGGRSRRQRRFTPRAARHPVQHEDQRSGASGDPISIIDVDQVRSISIDSHRAQPATVDEERDDPPIPERTDGLIHESLRPLGPRASGRQ